MELFIPGFVYAIAHAWYCFGGTMLALAVYEYLKEKEKHSKGE